MTYKNSICIGQLAFLSMILTGCFCPGIRAFSLGYSTEIPKLQQDGLSEPASIVLVIDMSISTSRGASAELQALSSSLTVFIQKNNPQNEYSVIDLRSYATLLLDRAIDPKVVLEKLNKLFSGRKEGGTALYEAGYLALKKAAQGRYHRRFILLASDGIDTTSSKTAEGLVKTMAGAGIPTYTISLSSTEKDTRIVNQGRRFLEAIAKVSGGKSFKPKNAEEIGSIMEDIGKEIRQ